MDETQESNKRIQTGTNLDPAVYAAVERLRHEEDRPMSRMINVLLKSHPRISPMLEAEILGAGA